MKILIIRCLSSSLILYSLMACNHPSHKGNTNKTETPTMITKDTLKALVKVPDLQKFNMEDFPEKWIQLTEVNGEKIIENPCDAVNGAFIFRKIKGHGYKMKSEGGQDEVDYLILSYNSRPDTLELVGKNMISKKDVTFTITKMDTINHTAHWEWTDMDWSGRKESIDMVTSKGKSKFKVVNDPPCL
jgi:hypothetical protein